MFPALSAAFKALRSGFGSDPLSLDIEGKAGGLTFDMVNVDWYARNGFRSIYHALSGGMPAWSGETVSLDTAQNHSVVWACRRIISESVAFMPLIMMQDTGKGKFPVPGHPLFNALRWEPNPNMAAMTFRETLTGHCVLGGNAYAQIVRRSGTGVAMELYPLMPQQVDVDRDAAKNICYIVKDGNAAAKTYTVIKGKPQDILHIPGIGNDGIRGYSVITVARQSIGTALGAERFAGKFFANGGRVPYNLKLTQPWKSQQDADKFRSDWESTYNDPHKVIMLEPWLVYEKTGMDFKDCQLLESRQFGIPEICRWFSVSPHLVQDLSRSTFSNVENLALQFVTFTLSAWITRWEHNLRRCLLTPEEKNKGFFFRHNVKSLLRGDFATRMAGYASALQNGHMNIDEVRDEEDLNPLADGAGENYHIQLNMASLPGGDAPIAQTQQLVQMNKPKNQ